MSRLFSIALILPLAGFCHSAPPAFPLPGGAGLYVHVRPGPDGRGPARFGSVFPTIGDSLGRLAAAVGCKPAPTEIALVGQLHQDRVGMAVFLRGGFDLVTLGRAIAAHPRIPGNGNSVSIYRIEPGEGHPTPIEVALLQDGTLAAASPGVLLPLLNQPGNRPAPASFRRAQSEGRTVTAYLSGKLLDRLFPKTDTAGNEFRNLHKILESIQETLIVSDLCPSGSARLHMICREETTTADLASFLQNLAALAPLSSIDSGSGLGALLHSPQVRKGTDSVDVTLTLPAGFPFPLFP